MAYMVRWSAKNAFGIGIPTGCVCGNFLGNDYVLSISSLGEVFLMNNQNDWTKIGATTYTTYGVFKDIVILPPTTATTNRYVTAITNNGYILQHAVTVPSTGFVWDVAVQPANFANENWCNIAFGANKCVALTYDGKFSVHNIYQNLDQWTEPAYIDSDAVTGMGHISFVNNMFYVHYGLNIYTSSDCETWTKISTAATVNKIFSVQDVLISFCNISLVSISTNNGVNWSTLGTSPEGFMAVAYNPTNKRFIGLNYATVEGALTMYSTVIKLQPVYLNGYKEEDILYTENNNLFVNQCVYDNNGEYVHNINTVSGNSFTII